MTVTRAWRVYGIFNQDFDWADMPSSLHNFSTDKHTRIIEVQNSDKTGTKKYSIVRIAADSAEECERELMAQLDDGLFENSNYGRTVEVLAR